MTNLYNVIGLMSGTSLDGLDIAFCRFQYQGGKWSFALQASKSIDYDDELRQRLKKSIALPALDLLSLNNEYGKWLGLQVNSFIKKFKIKADFVASHGHTVHHRPEEGITCQIGSGQEIADICNLKVICDFRSTDVSLGGQGAPLVPAGDKYLFSGYDFCLNLGGISNISFDFKGERIAYDIGLANMVLNYVTAQIGLKFDKGGRLAKSGNLHQELFEKLNSLVYYQLPFPKSTGYEWFVEEVVPLIDGSQISSQDKLCTAVHHIAYSIARDVKKFTKNKEQILVTGGGAKNSFLIECLRGYLSESVRIHIPDYDIIEYKEAIIFALLGVLRLRNEVNCFKSVTGATQDNCGGTIFTPMLS